MKKLFALLTALCMAFTAAAAPPKKDDKKGKDAKKDAPAAPAYTWDVIIEGTLTDSSDVEVKAILAGIKNLKVESIAKKDATVDAVVSSNMRLSKSDLSRAFKDAKSAYKVKDFKTKKPDKAGDKKEEPKKDEPKKPDPAKPGDTKPDPSKPDAPKPDGTKPDAPKPDAPKPDAPKTEEPKKDK